MSIDSLMESYKRACDLKRDALLAKYTSLPG